ncbi:aftiphilin a [Scomber japonicus]|uniref:aftiphilin a n=1 Tax=Scomber japonicus TaxID=13676 RepID=UPI0023067E99|nr:aftiphilin a [Scomber japonicus]
MEPDVIRMYSSSPPPMEDGAEEDDDEFGDFGTFSSSSGVPTSISFTEFDTPTTFNQTQALVATSPPEILNNGTNRVVVGGGSIGSSNGTHSPQNELSKANGHVGGAPPSDRTDVKKAVVSASTADCNGGGAEVLTNGFATFDVQGSPPPSQNSVHSHLKGTSSEGEEGGGGGSGGPEDDFADFAAFSNADGRSEDSGGPAGGDRQPDAPHAAADDERCRLEQGTTSEDSVRDTHRTGAESESVVPAEAPGGSCNTDRGASSHETDVDFAHERSESEAVCTKAALTLNGVVAAGDESKDDNGENDLSPDAKGSGNETETETETETSLGRPLSTDALEEFGDMSTTGSVPSPPPLQEETATPADHSQLAEDDEDEEDFGDFGDVGSFGGQGFADFEKLEAQQEESSRRHSSPLPPEQEAAPAATVAITAAEEEDDDFGDFNSPKFHSGGADGDDGGKFADFPVSDSFGNFSSAVEEGAGQEGGGAEEESWAAFGSEENAAPPADGDEEWCEREAPSVSEQSGWTDAQAAALSSRLEKLFLSSFPQSDAASVEDDVKSLNILLDPAGGRGGGGGGEEEKRTRPPCNSTTCRPAILSYHVVWLSFCRAVGGSVWLQLQDIHESLGLRYQWGGSYCNKALLCCLGIDTRNILFTGQKKQPVIVPMYAASLGMLEPTKEPVKPVSAAEMIASIAQAPPVAPEKSSSDTDAVQQEALPPVQFDWSSSGLTNPLDASGGSSLLNLDFFGPVEDSGSTSSPSIPGVDPELYELTTAKLDPSSRVADAFARLMSTMEKTSTSTRKPRKDENLSEEAVKVISGLPDLSFMQAKVLMFPATLTPLVSTVTPD